jgi:hypothetical protein
MVQCEQLHRVAPALLQTARGLAPESEVLMRPQSITVSCEHCGTSFLVEPARLRKGRGRFCSVACWRASAGSPTERFWERVARTDDPDSCWLWRGARDRDGYGSFRVNGRVVGAHQFAFVLAGGVVVDRLEVCHTCDVRACVRNDGAQSHLFQATHRANVHDMLAKGRGNKATGDRNGSRLYPERRPRGDQHASRLHPECMPRGDRNGARTKPEAHARGERSGAARLTALQVAEIRQRWAAGGWSYPRLGQEYGVSKTAVRNIIVGRTWRAS